MLKVLFLSSLFLSSLAQAKEVSLDDIRTECKKEAEQNPTLRTSEAKEHRERACWIQQQVWQLHSTSDKILPWSK